MGVIDMLTKGASKRAHVLVAEAPGAFRERVALECAVNRMGWCLAESVADADVLAVVGDPGEAFAAKVEHTWAQMSEPRERIHVRTANEAELLLGEAREQLREPAAHLTGRAIRRGFTPSASDMANEHEDQHGGGAQEHSAMMPDGIPLAEGAEDRDGLEMDELCLPLGPVLAHWPAGVVLRVTLHGDVVVDATVEQLAMARARQPDDAIERAARLLDAAGSVLALVGLPAEHARAHRLRDSCLAGGLLGGHEVAAFGDRIGRLRSLRWVLGGLAVEDRNGGPKQLHDLLTGLIDRARVELDQDATSHVARSVEAIPALVRGMELAAVRLWLAALMPDLAMHELSETAHD
ncbi:hypothetical protein [Aeromicrobium sp.]|uniref:hypothetical protein n=1 Tax=Aeromicrobium sp. TaxID=1871063 RepID=UPI003C6AC3D5